MKIIKKWNDLIMCDNSGQKRIPALLPELMLQPEVREQLYAN